MSGSGGVFDWRAEYRVTPEKMEELVRRIVVKGDPLQVILFGSRARGDHREDSDVDVAVVMDGPEEDGKNEIYGALSGLRMPVDLIVVSKAKFDLHRPWLNSIFNYIDEEGVVLYDRADPESTRGNTLQARLRGRVSAEVPAA